jgi:signal peptidase II
MRISFLRPRLIGIFILMAVFALDQWSKTALAHAAQAGAVPHEILPVFNLVMVRNHGISFGFFARGQAWMPLVLTLVTSAVALMLFIWLALARDWKVCLALGFIIGGALGNILDRIRLGAVTDFLDFHLRSYHWPAFNLADSAIFIGVVILVLISIVGRAEIKENGK